MQIGQAEEHFPGFPSGWAPGRFLGDLGDGREAAATLQHTHFVADQLIHLIGVKQKLGLPLLQLPMESPSASLTPGPGMYVFSSVMKGLVFARLSCTIQTNHPAAAQLEIPDILNASPL